MLLHFITENYLSFKERAELEFIAPNSQKYKHFTHKEGKHNVLKSIALYGANASGKSNLLKALSFMKEQIIGQLDATKDIPVMPFKLSSETESAPSIFEVTFLVKQVNYNKDKPIIFRYGFELDHKKIHKEWLFARFTSQESKLFTRTEDTLSFGTKFKEGQQVYKTLGSINEKALFLSLVQQLKGEHAIISRTILNWFRHMLNLTPIHKHDLSGFTLSLLEDKELPQELILEALKLSDLSIENFAIKEDEVEFSDNRSGVFRRESGKFFEVNITTSHTKYDMAGEALNQKVIFDFEAEESDGTKKFFAIIGPILYALKKGLILLGDEIDARLHPSLIKAIVSLFNSEANQKGAQFIFTTHHIELMNQMRKEQICFVEKNYYGESELYSLNGFKVRNDVSFSKNYYMGKFGAVPSLGNLESLIYKAEHGK